MPCWVVVMMLAAGKWGYYALGAYGSLAMAIFMVKTMKRVIFQETRAYGERALMQSVGRQSSVWGRHAIHATARPSLFAPVAAASVAGLQGPCHHPSAPSSSNHLQHTLKCRHAGL